MWLSSMRYLKLYSMSNQPPFCFKNRVKFKYGHVTPQTKGLRKQNKKII